MFLCNIYSYYGMYKRDNCSIDVTTFTKTTRHKRATTAHSQPTIAARRPPTTKMATVDLSKVPIVEKSLFKPDTSEVADVLSSGLKATFEHVTVEAVPCPDLTREPYGLAAPGLCGNPKLIELGGNAYLLPLVQRDKLYDAAAILRHLKRDPALLVGAGAGPWPYLGVNCEGIFNLSMRNDRVTQRSRAVSIEPRGAPKGTAAYTMTELPQEETRAALLGNYLLSDGAPGQVLKVVAKKRVGESNFITSIRETLQRYYGDRVVGLGGAFLLREGKVKHHVMPEFSKTEIRTERQVEEWLHYFEMRAPIVHLGTLVTGDLGLDLRVQHFHGTGNHGDGGHYHYDVTPGEVHYEGYFVVADSVIRIDAPLVTHQLGRD